MKKLLFALLSLFATTFSYAQCPDLIYAMVNACATGSTEGNNEFVVFNTSSASIVSNYNLIYNTVTPPFPPDPNDLTYPQPKALSGANAAQKIGTGSVTTTVGSCSTIVVTSSNQIIPANSRVIFIPYNLDQNYDVTNLCNGVNPLYVVYIDYTAIPGSWSAVGTLANSASGTNTLRYLQLAVQGNASCAPASLGNPLITLAPIKSYNANSWSPNKDGNAVTWNGNTASYNNTGCTAPVLPLSMIDVIASNTKDANIIKWRTVDEINTDKFVLERSYDGKNFNSVSNIKAVGSNSNSYQYNDNVSEYKTTYYRIKTIDKTGKSVYSRIVKVNPSRTNLSVNNVYPNPAKENISIEWNSLTKASAVLKIIDITGRVLQTENTMALTGYNKRILNVSKLPHGKYIIQISTDQDVVTANFNK